MALSIRTTLSLSYLALVVVFTLGLLAIEDVILNKLTVFTITTSEEGVKRILQANTEVSSKILTAVGEKFVENKAVEVAKELSYLLGVKKQYDYAAIRRDQGLRGIATQEILAYEGVAGYVDLIDNTGMSVLHPNREVEGRNFSQWREKFPEMWQLVSLAFTTPRVKGYYTFLDSDNRPREKFMALAQVPRTPFIVVAVVNIDQYFLPAAERIHQTNREIIARAHESIRKSTREMDRILDIIVISGGALLALLVIGAGLGFATLISRPIKKLRDGVREVGEGNFSVEVPPRGAKEVVHLAEAFNQLGEQLTDYMAKRDFIRDTFGRYVTQEVVKKLLEDTGALELGGETREVTILMSDLRGFTSLTANMPPEQVIIFLNRYLGKMIEILCDYRAVIDEIIGDGILAFFGAPEPLEDHPARAVACALHMQAAMAEINALNAADSLPHLEMGIAVNTGSVVVGNIGSELRTKYSVVGSPVNFTSRIEACAVGGQVLLSQATHDRVRDLVEVGGLIQAEMKGVPEPATLFEIRGIRGPYNLHLDHKPSRLVTLPEGLEVQLFRVEGKIVDGAGALARLTHVCDTAAILEFQGELSLWEDVRLYLHLAPGEPSPGQIYGKVVKVEPLDGGLTKAEVHFTSTSPKVYEFIRQVTRDDSDTPSA